MSLLVITASEVTSREELRIQDPSRVTQPQSPQKSSLEKTGAPSTSRKADMICYEAKPKKSVFAQIQTG